MNRLLSSTLVLLFPTLLLAGCGDGSGSSGSGGSTGGSTGGTGGSTGGTGGATGGTGGATGGTGGATGGTGGASGACTNAADMAIVSDPNNPIQDAVGKCAQDNLGAEPATKDCIKALGLSDACTTCFDDEIQCVVANCLADCSVDPNSQACTECRAANCDPAFADCSGLTP